MNDLTNYPIYPFVFVENSFTGLKQNANPGINKSQFFLLCMMIYNKLNKDLNFDLQVKNSLLLAELQKNKKFSEEPAFPVVYFENDKQIVLPGLTFDDLEFICNILNIDLDKLLLQEYAYPIKTIIT